ncbi:MAG: DUF4457 domain-containing protein, partial [Kiritimatiellaeota bacterium]|nr:DUF4457 domain-containing protein [Kiritimatiellota bacterium]
MKKIMTALLPVVLAATARAQAPDDPAYLPVPYNPAWTATAKSYYNVGADIRYPQNALNTLYGAGGKGLDAEGKHNTDAASMWMTTADTGALPGVWYRVDFNEEVRFNAIKLWNFNPPNANTVRGVK